MCDTTPDSCKRCCRMNLNTSCFVMQPEEMLPDGTPCKTGFCNKGVCEPTMTDIVVRIWGFFEDFNLNSVMRFLKVRFFGIAQSKNSARKPVCIGNASYLAATLVRNIWFCLLSFPQNERTVCILFEESVFIFQFLNDKINTLPSKSIQTEQS